MFRRRKPLTILHHVRNFFWPRIGWRRSAYYFGHRVGRLKASRYAIAAGFAFGAAMSFTPLVGLHIVSAAMLAWMARASVIASAIGTLVGNPWTFPFIWLWIYRLGRWMGFGEPQNGDRIEFTSLFGNVVKSALRVDIAYLQEIAWPVLGPMLAGSIPTAIVAWLVSFYVIHWLLGIYRAARLVRLNRKRHAEQAAAASQEERAPAPDPLTRPAAGPGRGEAAE